jgi:hypothetical protein
MSIGTCLADRRYIAGNVRRSRFPTAERKTTHSGDHRLLRGVGRRCCRPSLGYPWRYLRTSHCVAVEISAERVGAKTASGLTADFGMAAAERRRRTSPSACAVHRDPSKWASPFVAMPRRSAGFGRHAQFNWRLVGRQMRAKWRRAGRRGRERRGKGLGG